MNFDLRGIIFEPIVPIPIMAVICVVLIVFKRRGITPYIRQILAVILLFVVNLRPMYPSDNITVKVSKTDLNVILVLDDTISMLADDQAGYENRMDKAKQDMYYIIENLPGAEFTVIAFNNSVHVMTPFTDSTDYIRNAIDSVYPLSPLYALGTNLSDTEEVIGDVISDLEDRQENCNIVLFFLSDGENTNNARLTSFDDLADHLSGGAVLGYGTERGGHMRYYDDLRDTENVVMEGDHEAVTRLDEDSLRSIASDMGITYANMNHESALEPIVTGIREMSEAEPEDETKQGYVDIYFIPMVPLVLLTAYEFISLKRRG